MKILSKAVDLIKKTIEFVYFIRSSNNLENYGLWGMSGTSAGSSYIQNKAYFYCHLFHQSQ